MDGFAAVAFSVAQQRCLLQYITIGLDRKIFIVYVLCRFIHGRYVDMFDGERNISQIARAIHLTGSKCTVCVSAYTVSRGFQGKSGCACNAPRRAAVTKRNATVTSRYNVMYLNRSVYVAPREPPHARDFIRDAAAIRDVDVTYELTTRASKDRPCLACDFRLRNRVTPHCENRDAFRHSAEDRVDRFCTDGR